MNTVLALVASTLLIGQPQACTAEVQRQEDAFRLAYPNPPAKPAQAAVIGRDGQVLDAAIYRKRLAELSAARGACAAQTGSLADDEAAAGRKASASAR